jgi:hypothetical protein
MLSIPMHKVAPSPQELYQPERIFPKPDTESLEASLTRLLDSKMQAFETKFKMYLKKIIAQNKEREQALST